MSEDSKELGARISYLEEKVLELQKINLSQEKEKNVIFKAIREMYEINNQIMLHISKIFGNQNTLDVNQNITKVRCDNLRYELLDPLLRREDYYFPVIRSTEETIEEIIQNHRSMARFGDGEFSPLLSRRKQ